MIRVLTRASCEQQGEITGFPMYEPQPTEIIQCGSSGGGGSVI